MAIRIQRTSDDIIKIQGADTDKVVIKKSTEPVLVITRPTEPTILVKSRDLPGFVKVSRPARSTILVSKPNIIVGGEAEPFYGYTLADGPYYDATHAYTGFSNLAGEWFISRRDRSTNIRLYVYGNSDYATAWDSKEGLTYG